MENGQPMFDGKVGTILIAMGSASFIITIFHLIILCRTHHRLRLTNQNPLQQQQPQPQPPDVNISLPPHLIPLHTYQKKKKTDQELAAGGVDDDDDDEDAMCAVCLGEFEDGEELRTLPECMHSFHVACIDTWLSSRSSCPVCRAHAAPSPAVERPSPELGSASFVAHHFIDMTQITRLQNGSAPH